jgi:hypothetical protein
MPIDDARQPNLTALLKASATVGRAPQSGDIVVYASTVYPGATEEDCVPVLEQESGLKEEPISPSVTRQNVSIRATAAPKQSKWRPLKPNELSIRAVLKSRWGFTIAFAAQGQVRSVDRTEVDL